MPLVGLAIGTTLAVVIKSSADFSPIAAFVLQQCAVIASLVVGLMVGGKGSTRKTDIIRGAKTLALLVAVLTAVTFAAMLWIELPAFQYIGLAVDAIFQSIGWYPPGADAPFPLAIAIWSASVMTIILIAATAADVIRRLMR